MHEPGGPWPPFGGEEAACPFESARVAVLPVPFESTVSYGGGTARGPEAILRASTQVELWDEQLGAEPFRVGIWTEAPLPVQGRSARGIVSDIGVRFGALMDAGKLDPQVSRVGSWSDPMPLVQALLDREVEGKAVLLVD